MKKITELETFNFDVDSARKNLIKKYEEKLQDTDFLRIASSLNNKDCYLFVNEIEQVVNEEFNCSQCPGLENCPNIIKGQCYGLKNQSGVIVEHYTICDKKLELEYLKNILVFGKTKGSNITTHSEFFRDPERKDVIDYINNIVESKDLTKKGIYLSGSFGTGKSYIMSIFIKALAKEGFKCGYAYFPELLVELKKEFDQNSKSLLEKIKKLDVLVIDDIGSEKVSEWSRDEVLGTILQYRMDNKLFTCFTSNYNLDELLKHYNKDREIIKANRIVDRIKYLTKSFDLVGKNYRNK